MGRINQHIETKKNGNDHTYRVKSRYICDRCGDASMTKRPKTIVCYVHYNETAPYNTRTNAGYKHVCEDCYSQFLKEYTNYFPYARTEPKENYK